jgi:LPS-assembly protein
MAGCLLGAAAAGLLLAAAAPPAQAAGNQWNCAAGSDGRWVCSPRTAPPARQYERPKWSPAVRSTAAGKAEATAAETIHHLDWVPLEALDAEQRKQVQPGCCGAYIEPVRRDPEASLLPENAPLRATANTTDADGPVATLSGDVQLAKGKRQVRSDRARINRDTNEVVLEGDIRFREPGVLLLGDRAQLDTQTQEAQLDNATFVLHQSRARGTAQQFRRDDEGVIYIDNATYTTCEPASNTWLQRAAKVRIDADGRFATARHARIAVKDVPVIYTPWIRFPIDNGRATGLLFPRFAMGEENGFDFAQPIYLNLAPNYDATLTPRYIQERGEMLEGEFRHLSRFDDTVLSGAWLGDDAGGNDSDEDVDPASGKRRFEGKDRWLVGIDHVGGMGQAWNTLINYTEVSDVDYFQDLGASTLEANGQAHLLQLFSAGYQLDHWRMNVARVEYQTIAEDLERQYQQLPRIDLDGDYRFDDLDLLLTLNHQYTLFDHPDDTKVTGDRLRADYALAWDKRWMWGFLRPSAKLKHIGYTLDDPVVVDGDDNPAVTVPVADFDAGLYFERDTTWLFKGFTQTLEPRLYYLNAQFEDQTDQPDFDTSDLTFSYQQLFRDDRFSGGDRIGDANQLTVGITSRLLDTRGVERLRGSIGQIEYLDDRYVSLEPMFTKAFLKSLSSPGDLADATKRETARQLLRDESPYAAELAARLGEHWRLQNDVLYSEQDDKIDKGSLSLRYDRDRTLFNAAYRYTRESPRLVDSQLIDTDIEQTDLSAYLPLTPQWAFIGRWNHDLTNSRELEFLGGFEYDSCCWRLSMLVRRWLDRQDDLLIPEEELEYDQGVFLQVQLKGLAGSGKQVENILTDSIYGYEPR